MRDGIARSSAALAAALVLACGSDGPSTPVDRNPASLAVETGGSVSGVVATMAGAPVFRVTDAAGAGVPNVDVTFTVNGGGWVVSAATRTDAAGRASASWYLGPQPGSGHTLTATAGTLSATATATAAPLQPGTTYTGANGYVEFRAGDLPLIVTAPHGGRLQPSSIPERTRPGAVTIADADTDVLAADIHSAVASSTGGTPHVVIVHLHRNRLDANRDLDEAAEGHPAAVRAWREFHGFIEAARVALLEDHGRGLYIDLHGHGHDLQRLELGYLLTRAQLAADDATLNSTGVVRQSSIRRLAESGGTSHAQLLRGPVSMGSLFEFHGYPAVPSPDLPHPGEAPYFTGGYNTERYGSASGGAIDGVQIEANRQGVRDTQTNRERFAAAFADVVEAYFQAHYGATLAGAAAR